MYYGRKKGIIIAIVVLVIILILAGVGTFLFLGTDMFKPADSLFYKYMGDFLEDFEFKENVQLSNIENLKKNEPYTSKTSITANISSDNNSSNYYGAINQSKLNILSKIDNSDKKSYVKGDLSLNGSNIFSVEYANNDDIYALKSDEIVTAFIGVENNNLKVLAQKIGNGINANNIPDKIEIEENKSLYEITPQEKERLKELMTEVLKQNLESSYFSKENNTAIKREGISYNATGYRLNLNQEQLKTIQIAMLEAISKDSIIMNLISTKAKTLGLGEEYTEINKLSQTINKQIQEIRDSEMFSEGISITVYVENGKPITTDILLKNNAKITIYAIKNETNTTRNILVQNLALDGEVSELQFNKLQLNVNETLETNKSIYDIAGNIDDMNITLYINSTGGAIDGNVNTEANLTIINEGTTYEFSLENELEFADELDGMVTLSRNNCAVLNDYPTDQLQSLLKGLGDRMQYVLNEKATLLGINLTGGSIEPKINEVMKQQEIATFNAKFENYLGQMASTNINSLIDIIKNNNKDTQNKIISLTMDGADVQDLSSIKIDSNKKYLVEAAYDTEGFISQIKITSQI